MSRFVVADYAFSVESLCIFALALPVFTAALWVFQRRRPAFPLPPGPCGYPVVGNLFDMPSLQNQGWLTFAKWGEIYGIHQLHHCRRRCDAD